MTCYFNIHNSYATGSSYHMVLFVLQVVSQCSALLSPMCVDAVLKVIDPATDVNVDLRDIKIIKKLG